MVVAAIALAGALSLGWSALSVRIGPSLGMVDHPGASLKAHEKPAVLLGGVGVYLGVFGGLAVAGAFEPDLAAAALAVLLLGLADDRFELASGVRLTGEMVVALVTVGLATPIDPSSPLALLLGALLVMVTVNAVNLVDGLDGLAGAAALVTAVGLAALALGGDELLPLMLAAALAGFLPFNWHVARVFLGDHGAYLLGLLLGIVILRRGGGEIDVSVAVGCVVLGVFVVDLVATVLRRVRSGRSLFAGDRSHLYDQLRDRGMPVRRIALATGAVQSGFVAVAWWLDGLAPAAASLGIAAVISVVLALLVMSGALTPVRD